VICVYDHAGNVIETDEHKGARLVQQSVCHPSRRASATHVIRPC
jgi:hypothetical protein